MDEADCRPLPLPARLSPRALHRKYLSDKRNNIRFPPCQAGCTALRCPLPDILFSSILVPHHRPSQSRWSIHQIRLCAARQVLRLFSVTHLSPAQSSQCCSFLENSNESVWQLPSASGTPAQTDLHLSEMYVTVSVWENGSTVLVLLLNLTRYPPSGTF